MSTEKEQNFEDALKELEGIVHKLEKEDLALEKSLSLYEKGIELSAFCSDVLEKAELRIEKVHEGGENQ